ncbi:glucose-1-phosphate thymidylyltransferase [Streptomyces sp. NBC_00696]|uniref:glucose-1-phosphate thymidylyltransferase n=1 Tax=Streptomyces sp. NBC_00696 TaxID=2903672 RepID=UPI002E2F16AA|nr:glucose-1-phosphate thymidylyltransferase [Streptomyces sp. NBC_00696]
MSRRRLRALVLAGGRGTRLRPFTPALPKQLMPVAGKPVLVRCLEQLPALGVSEAAVIVGDGRPQIEAVLGDGSGLGLSVTYVPQPEPLGLAHCVALARAFLGDDSFVLCLGDVVVTDGLAAAHERFVCEGPDAVVLTAKVADPRQYGVVEVDGRGRVLALAEKPRVPRSDLVLAGVYFLSPAVHKVVAGLRPSARGELEITDALAALVADGATVLSTPVTGYWKDVGDVEAVLDCNRVLMEALAPERAGSVDAASRLDGTVVVETGASVLRSRLIGPVLVGAGSVVRDSRVGPYTAIGRDCRVSDTEITGSVLLDGAVMAGLDGVHNSVIGRGAEVRAAHPRTDRCFLVGDHTYVEV